MKQEIKSVIGNFFLLFVSFLLRMLSVVTNIKMMWGMLYLIEKVKLARRNVEPLILESPINITELEENVGKTSLNCLSPTKLERNKRVSLGMGQVSPNPIRSSTL